MAKVECKLVGIYAPLSRSKELMRTLQELSVIDLETAAGDEQTAGCPQGYESGGAEVNADIWERGLAAAENALGILNERFPDKRGIREMLSGPPDIPRD